MINKRREPRTRDAHPVLTVDRVRDATSGVLSECPEVEVAYAFGSRVTGSSLPSSDFDLAFVLSDEADISDDPLLAERLAARIATRLRTPIDIDAHLADRLPLNVRGRVVTEGILLYESDPIRRVEFETHTRRLYFDFLPFIERDAREALLSGG